MAKDSKRRLSVAKRRWQQHSKMIVFAKNRFLLNSDLETNVEKAVAGAATFPTPQPPLLLSFQVIPVTKLKTSSM